MVRETSINWMTRRMKITFNLPWNGTETGRKWMKQVKSGWMALVLAAQLKTTSFPPQQITTNNRNERKVMGMSSSIVPSSIAVALPLCGGRFFCVSFLSLSLSLSKAPREIKVLFYSIYSASSSSSSSSSWSWSSWSCGRPHSAVPHLSDALFIRLISVAPSQRVGQPECGLLNPVTLALILPARATAIATAVELDSDGLGNLGLPLGCVTQRHCNRSETARKNGMGPFCRAF